jgi:[ribosomal protein S5]-alanine N-acetyltransferase
MSLEFRRLPEVNPADITELMNNPQVRKEMPLTKDNFNEDDAKAFVAGKERLWQEYGFGPWAFFIDGQFAGWGGVQPEAGEADLALVLHPKFWGMGKRIYDEIIKRAFGEMGLKSVVIFFPPSRTRVRGLQRLGFVQDGEMVFGDERFIRYRLRAPLT